MLYGKHLTPRRYVGTGLLDRRAVTPENMTRRRTPVPALVVAALLLTAGCAQFGTTPGPSTGVPTATPTETPRPATGTPTPTASEPSETTREPVGTGSVPHDLTVLNAREEAVTLDVTVVRNATGDRIFVREVALGQSESRHYEVQFPVTGNYTVRTTVGGATYEYAWEVERVPLSYVLQVTARPDGEVTYGRTAA